jgi:hypothetical protein
MFSGFDAGEQDVFRHESNTGWEADCIPNPHMKEAAL